MSQYFRPLVQLDPFRTKSAIGIAGGWTWFDHVEVLERGKAAQIVPATEVPEEILGKISEPRSPVAGVTMTEPRLMGILNITPDSFSDGGAFDTLGRAVAHGVDLIEQGADYLDVGGESTRPGAKLVPVADEIERVQPVIRALVAKHQTPISIDTRKAPVASAAIGAGAAMLNDVSALRYDAQLSEIASESELPICLMHSLSDPENMQSAAQYDDVLLDVYDHLAQRIDYAVDHGIKQHHIVIDPGIGFAKTLDHNLTLLRGLSLFHGLGCPILLGTSRKRFIGAIGHAPDPMARMPGSVALALAGFAQGVQIMRVHDMAETKQALRLWAAATGIGQNQ